jgi:hypothetical protein
MRITKYIGKDFPNATKFHKIPIRKCTTIA